MGILRFVLGPSRKEIWKQLAKDIGGEYEAGGFFREDVLCYQHRHWAITLKASESQKNKDY